MEQLVAQVLDACRFEVQAVAESGKAPLIPRPL
jgi:hypothetical protein